MLLLFECDYAPQDHTNCPPAGRTTILAAMLGPQNEHVLKELVNHY